MRLIDADALHEALNTKQKWVVRCGDKHNEGYTYDQVHFAIDNAPTIDAVEAVRGEWKDRSDGGRILYPWTESHECSICESWGSSDWNYCPYCGADMRKESE